LHLLDAKPSTCRAKHDAYYALACCAQAYQPHPLIHRIIKLLYQSEAGLVIAVGCAQVRKVPRHQCRCDTSTARILSDAQPVFGRYEYERPNVSEGIVSRSFLNGSRAASTPLRTSFSSDMAICSETVIPTHTLQ
jgi:hypothetical protein